MEYIVALVFDVQAAIGELICEFFRAAHDGQQLAINLGFKHVQGGICPLSKKFKCVSRRAGECDPEYTSDREKDQQSHATNQDSGQRRSHACRYCRVSCLTHHAQATYVRRSRLRWLLTM